MLANCRVLGWWRRLVSEGTLPTCVKGLTGSVFRCPVRVAGAPHLPRYMGTSFNERKYVFIRNQHDHRVPSRTLSRLIPESPRG